MEEYRSNSPFFRKKPTFIVSGFAKAEKIGYGADRMEAAYGDYQSHLNVLHYPVDSVDDFELTLYLRRDTYDDVRNYADVNLETEKLFPLLDRVIIASSFNP